jgi:hypothetical protein
MLRAGVSTVVALAAVSIVCCSGRKAGFPEVDGWTRTGDVSVYEAENLWEYINGAAELFVDYGVLTCSTADLSSGDVTVAVDLYDMGTPLNAFGVFNLESSSRGEPFPDAIEAVISPPYQALLLKGATYVKLNAVEGELTEAIGLELLEGIADDLRGSTAYPEDLKLLPQNGRIAGTEGYQAVEFLGLTELNDCLFAEYAGEGGETWTGFVLRSSPGSLSPWNELVNHWDSLGHDGRTVLFREIPYRGLTGIIQTEDGIVGASGAADRSELLHRLDAFIH